MGRDRDRFDRALEALRQRVSQHAFPQGAPLSVKALATEFGVSQTPVREVLARLAGEGLITHTATGYVGLTHGRESLAHLYELAGVLAEAVVAGPMVAPPSSQADAFDRALASGANGAMTAALGGVRARLAPFERAEILVLGQDDREAFNTNAAQGVDRLVLAAQARRYFRRRAWRSGDILARALGLA